MLKDNPDMEAFSAFLPTEWDDFAAIRWGSELSIVYDAVFRLNALDETLLDALMSAGGGEGGGEPEGGEPEPAVQLALQNAQKGAPYMSAQDINNLLADEEEPEKRAVYRSNRFFAMPAPLKNINRSD
jgi:hypothetical protein